MDKYERIKKKIDKLKKKENLELKKTIKHRCFHCGKKFKAMYYQTINCKYCNMINRTKGLSSSSVSRKLIKEIKKIKRIGEKNEDGDHDNYHCRKCEIDKLESPNCVVCGEPFELKESHFWDLFYLCEKCDKENKLEYSIKCPNCKKSVSELLESKFKDTLIHQEHMIKCNKVFIRFRKIAKRDNKNGKSKN